MISRWRRNRSGGRRRKPVVLAAADGPSSDRVEDDPADAVADGGTGTSDPGPVALATGAFVSRSRYDVRGQATVDDLHDAARTLRLQDFSSTNGPDLFVYLATGGEDVSAEAISDDDIDLGRLKGNVGNQNDDVPAGVDLEIHDTVVIWCQPFSVAFGVAHLPDDPEGDP